MALTAAELTRLRSMSGESLKEPSERILLDIDLQDLADSVGKIPDVDGNAPSSVDYTDTYDLYRAAAEAWRIKAGVFAEQFDFESEGARFNRSQKYRMALQQASRYASMAANLTINTSNVE